MFTIGFLPFALGFYGVCLPFFAASHTPRRSAALFFSILLIFRFTLFPVGGTCGAILPMTADLSALKEPFVNLRLFQTVARYLPHPALFVKNILGNIALFLPFGFCLRRTKTGRRFPRALLYGALLSLSVELVQLFLPSRCTDVDDLLLNTVGTALGALFSAAFLRARHSFFCCS